MVAPLVDGYRAAQIVGATIPPEFNVIESIPAVVPGCISLLKLILVAILSLVIMELLHSALLLGAAAAIGPGVTDEAEREGEKRRYGGRMITLTPALVILVATLCWLP